MRTALDRHFVLRATPLPLNDLLINDGRRADRDDSRDVYVRKWREIENFSFLLRFDSALFTARPFDASHLLILDLAMVRIDLSKILSKAVRSLCSNMLNSFATDINNGPLAAITFIQD